MLNTNNIFSNEVQNNSMIIVQPQASGVFVFYNEFYNISVQLSLKIMNTSGPWDCVYCVQSKMFWTLDTFCTNT